MRTQKANFAVGLACAAVCAGGIALFGGIPSLRAGGTTATLPSTPGTPGSSTAGGGQTPAPEPQTRLGIIHFIPPPGWQAAEQPGRDARIFVSPDSTGARQAAIVVLLTQPLGPSFDFQARFAKAVENAADGQPITERGPIVPGKSRQGCDTLEQAFAYKNSAGELVRGRLLAARVGDRLAAFWYLATGEELFKKHADDLADLLSTVRFDAEPATGPATLPTTAPSPITKPQIQPELDAIEREKSELRRRLADLESKEKGMDSTSAAESRPTTVPGPAAPAANGAAGSIDVTDRSRNGAWLRTRYPKRTRLVLTLTPEASGNSEVRPISCDIERLPETAHLTGFPAGRYRLTAKAVTPDEHTWPLKITTSPTPQAPDWADAVHVDPTKGVSIGVTDAPKQPGGK